MTGWPAPSFRRCLAPRAVVALGACTLLAGCGGILNPQGPVASAQLIILMDALVIMLAIVVPTMIATLVFAWWFRASNARATYRPSFAYSGRIEILVWSIPILVIMFLGGVIWVGSHDLDPFKPLPTKGNPVEVQVVALDWKWLFIYPEQGVASVNQLVVPAGVPVHFTMTGASVFNTFFIPQLGGMIYVMNGMVTQLHLQADRIGDYYGRSGHFSGDGFPEMQFTVHAVLQPDFDDWVAKTRGGGPRLDEAAYQQLEKQGVTPQPVTYGAVDPVLFHRIATQRIPPAPGPNLEAESAAVHPRAEK
ncbi:MAG TPA: ubiquinol oxidase subunit II [Acetobacteraceae bacterium]|nr:ubiquinol oxidase subunit II [Acetobacteraceae bacterium]